TYGQFGQRVAALSNALIALGVSKGSRIAVIAPNGLRYMECYYAAAVAGFVLVPINHRLTAEEIASIFADAEVDLVIGHIDFADRIEKAIGQSAACHKIIWLPGTSLPKGKDYEQLLSEHSDLPLPEVELQADDLAQLYYTSGTTGKPKGVMLSHGN